MRSRFLPTDLIMEIDRSGGKGRLLEIGCGEGRALMELRQRFPKLDLHGINKAPWRAMRGQRSLRRTGTHYRIFSRDAIRSISLPKVYFYDAEKLRFPDSHFDFVISQAAIMYLRRKDTLIEEVWRVLKKGGIALLNVDHRHESPADFLSAETPRFVIYREGTPYSLGRLISQKKTEGFDIEPQTHSNQTRRPRRFNIIMRKNRTTALSLGLRFDDKSSFNLNVLNKEKANGSTYWGYRSVSYCQCRTLQKPVRRCSGVEWPCTAP